MKKLAIISFIFGVATCILIMDASIATAREKSIKSYFKQKNNAVRM